MKKYLFLITVLIVSLFHFSFSLKLKGGRSLLSNGKTHFTASGDINFNLIDNIYVNFIRLYEKRKVVIVIAAVLISKDSSVSNPVTITLVGATKPGTYSLRSGQDSVAAVISYVDMDKNVFLSMNTLQDPGYIKIDSLSEGYISGSYKTTISNTILTSFSFSGIFSGDFYKEIK